MDDHINEKNVFIPRGCGYKWSRSSGDFDTDVKHFLFNKTLCTWEINSCSACIYYDTLWLMFYVECSSIILHNKLTDLALPVATLEAFWGRWWPLSELLEIRAFFRVPVCSTVTGLVVVPGFSVRFTVMEELISHVIPPYPPPSSLPSVLPSVFHPRSLSICPLMNRNNRGSPLCQTLSQIQ